MIIEPGIKRYDANKMVDTFQLANVLQTQPYVFREVVKMFAYTEPMFMSLLSLKGMHMDGSKARYHKKNTFKAIGNKEFQWRGEAPPKIVSILTRTVPSVNGRVGENNAKFVFYLDKNYEGKNDVIILKDRRTQIFLHSHGEQVSNNEFKYIGQMVRPDSYIPSYLLESGSEVGHHDNSHPEKSKDGNQRTTYGDWYRNWTNTLRCKISITGDAANSEIRTLTHTVNGHTVKYWEHEQNIEAMRFMLMEQDMYLFQGESTMRPDGSCSLYQDGKPVVRGAGAYHQADRSLRKQYHNLKLRDIEDIMGNMELTAGPDGETCLYVLAGQRFRFQFNRILRDTFKEGPQTLYIDKAENGGQGVKTNFSFYNFSGIKLYVSPAPVFDSQFMPKWTDSFGVENESNRAVFINLGKTTGGDNNIDLVTLGNGLEDRSMVIKDLDGMTTWGKRSDNRVSTPVDAKERHFLSQIGIKLSNPYSMAELYTYRRS